MLRILVSLARPVQWVKNGVVLAALVFGGEVDQPDAVERAILAVIIFCFLSSSVYVFNDLIDREVDRQHPLKKDRPLASGAVSTGQATILMITLLALAGVGTWYLGRDFAIVAGVYLVLNAAYSLALKNVVILDVMCIAIGFVLRAQAGAEAIDVTSSKWLLINTLLLALFLGFGKRRHELLVLEENATAHRKILGKYSPYLLDQCMGVTTASVVVMYMLYTFSPEVSLKLGTDYLYLTIPFVVYGIFRYLYLVHKESKGGSPTQVLFTDMPLLVNIILWLAAVIVILYA